MGILNVLPAKKVKPRIILVNHHAQPVIQGNLAPVQVLYHVQLVKKDRMQLVTETLSALHALQAMHNQILARSIVQYVMKDITAKTLVPNHLREERIIQRMHRLIRAKPIMQYM
eukprot:TRINITY_DN817_c0_g1_i4.p7 TRINITY_DN817_c0_g1~~TRINITY_DN817_c0_g1_i4.p7  ORF type:complete len:114 (-),score=7.13 TRINITY_DN817_c0_g1_i4:6-347(-)